MKDKILQEMCSNINKNDFSNDKICISFVGGPGYGKTTIANILCEDMNLFHCSNDYIARELEKNGVDVTDYETKTKLVSEIAFPFQDFLFSNDISFVLDANLMLYLDVLRNRCKNYGYRLYIIELQIDKKVALERSLKRLASNDPNNLSDSDEADFNLFLGQYEEYKKQEKPEYIFAKINTELDIKEQVNRIIKEIRSDMKEN